MQSSTTNFRISLRRAIKSQPDAMLRCSSLLKAVRTGHPLSLLCHSVPSLLAVVLTRPRGASKLHCFLVQVFVFCLFSELAPSQWHEHAGEIGQCCWEWAFPLPWLLLQMHTEFVCYVTQKHSDANSSVQTLHSEQLNPDFWAVQFLLLEGKEAWTPELSHCMCWSLVFNFTEAQTVDYNTAQI